VVIGDLENTSDPTESLEPQSHIAPTLEVMVGAHTQFLLSLKVLPAGPDQTVGGLVTYGSPNSAR